MDTAFEDVWQRADTVPGWLKRGQAEILWTEASALAPGSTVLEIGSHQGRSTIVLAAAMRSLSGHVLAVDPFVDGRLFGGATTREKFARNLDDELRDGIVELVPAYSTEIRPTWDRRFDLLYIDGKHDYWTLSDDLRWAAHLPSGAGIVIHDCFSSIGVTLGILRHVLFSDSIAYERRSDSQALFRVRRPARADRLRILAEMPWWVRNVFIKVLLRLRLRPLARLLGHTGAYDPY